MFAIGGAMSGLDTTSMIRQLMDVERAPIYTFESRQAALRRQDDAWGGIVTKLSTLQSSVDKLKQPDALASKVAVSSSDESVATVTPATGAKPGSLTFSVAQLAAAHQTASSGTFASTSSLVGAGSYELTVDGQTTTITTDGSTTLADLAGRIDDLDGVTAQVVKVSDGVHQLIVASEETGLANAHSVTTDLSGLDAGTELRAAADAQITLGSGASAITVSRSSNQVTDLLDGVTIGLKSAGGETTVTVAPDSDGVVESIKGLVDAVNGALREVKKHTAYDAASNRGGVLLGNSVTRSLSGDLRMAISDTVAGLTGDHTFASSVGISLTRTGEVELDETKLRDALAADPDAVANLFSRGGVASGSGYEYAASTTKTTPGTYEVNVSQIARVAAITGTTYAPPALSPETFTITAPDGTTVSVTVAVGANAAAAVSAINDAVAAANVTGLTASETSDGLGGSAIRLETTAFGSSQSFTVGANGVGLTAGTYTGQDVAGTVGGEAATGSGRILTASSGAPDGLAVRVTGAATGVLGDLTVTSGIADRLDRVLARYLDADGLISTARDSIETRIDDYDDQIEAYEERLEIRERALRRQFTAMETSMATLSAQGGWMAAQMGMQA